MAADQLISLEEIKKHTKEEDCWLAIYGARQHLSARVAVLPVAQGVSTCVSKWCTCILWRFGGLADSWRARTHSLHPCMICLGCAVAAQVDSGC
jgi:hypothetical protein